MTHDFVFISEHTLSTRTYAYTAANLISRLKVQEFLTRFPQMDKEPTHVPQFIIDLNQTADALVRYFLSQTTASANQ